MPADTIIAMAAAIAIPTAIAVLVGLLFVGGRAASPAGGDMVVTQRGFSMSRPAGRTARPVARSFVPKGYLGWVERQIVLAGRPPGWSLDRIFIAKPLLMALFGVIAALWVIGDPTPVRVGLGVIVIVLAFFVPELLIRGRAKERQEQIQLALPDTLDQMTISVEAGLGFESAMAKAATNGTGPLADELVRTLQDMSIGRSRSEAYESLSSRVSSIDLRRFTRAVVQADRYGIAVADILRVQAGEMRLKRRQRAEEKAMAVPVKVIFPLVFCILPVLFIVLLTPAFLNALEAFS
jgi:tight adherence protein C